MRSDPPTRPAVEPRARDRALTGRLSRRGVLLAAAIALIASFLQSPGLIAADTKLDLTANPLGFLARAAHLWSPDAPMGQVQNQAYGYFFPHGAFFAAGELINLPPWVTQRVWWALLITVGFVGVVRLGEALGIGSPGSRVIAGVAFVLSPRVLTTLGSISSETLPMMLAPWVLLPVVRALDRSRPGAHRPLWRDACRSAVAVALMGAVNAVATLAALGVAVVWWLLAGLGASGAGRRAWTRFGAWWAAALAVACAWWVVPLLILSRVSPPFLDFIESSRVTTEWTSLTEVLRGTGSWTPYVSTERVTGAVLVTQPAAVLATGVLAAAGLAGLCMRHMPFRRRWATILVIGLVVMCLGYAGGLGSPVAEPIRVFLDGPGAFLRNVHKFEPFVRLPLVLGLAHLLARVPLPGTVSWRTTASAFAHPQRSRPVAAAMVVAVAIIGAGSLFWTGQIAPDGAYRALPDYWQQTANWLSEHRDSDSTGTAQRAPSRALVVPGAPFADQLWGLTRDEPLQPLAETPWAVRDAIPLTPPGAIRALDSVQRDIAAGRSSPGLAATLAQQGIGYVVLRADLDPITSRSARPLLAQQALTGSPGLDRVATFGPAVGPPTVPGVVRDSGLRPTMPAIQIFAVHADTGFPGTGPMLVDADKAPRVVGGPESLATIQDLRARTGQAPLGPAVLQADAARAGLPQEPVVVTDSPTRRETDFGRVDDHSSSILRDTDGRRTQNAEPDYPVAGQPMTQGQWLLDNRPGEVSVSTSGSASDATQPGQTSPANSPVAAFDGDTSTAWVSGGLDSAVGQWFRLDFSQPRSGLAVRLTTAKALGPDVDTILVTTEAGSTVARAISPGKPVTVTLPSGATRWVQIRAVGTTDGRAGNQFALGEVGLVDLTSGLPLTIRHRVVLPEIPAGTPVAGWVLGQELSGRAACVDDSTRGRAPTVRCAPGLGLAPETPGLFTRALSVPAPVSVTPSMVLRPKPGDALDALLATSGMRAEGASSVNDPRGSAAAAVDGDPSTMWTAPDADDASARTDESDGAPSEDDDDGRARGDRTGESGADSADRPELTVTLPTPRPVNGLKLVLPRDYPAAPTRVAVDLGTGRQVRDVGRDGTVRLREAATDRIRITVLAHRDLIDVNSLGFSRDAPPGIAEVEVLPMGNDGASGTPAPPGTPGPSEPSVDDRVIDIGCGAASSPGIGITVSGRVIPMSVRTTAGALRNGEPVLARPCAADPVPLGAGEQEMSANPGAAFSVETVGLDARGIDISAAVQQISSPRIGDWSETYRTVSVAAAGNDRLLVVPESTNDGWRAILNGRTLQPVTMNGWQQGFLVPAGEGGEVVLTFRFDSVYRWALGIGWVLLGLVVLAAIWPTGGRRTEDDEDAEDAEAPGDGGRDDGTANGKTANDGVPHNDADHDIPPALASTVPADPSPDTSAHPLSAAGLVAGGVAWLATAWLLTGWWGLVLAVIAGAAVVVVRPRVRVVVAFLAMLLATIGLASGPWHSTDGYRGFDGWVQACALLAVACVVTSVLIPGGPDGTREDTRGAVDRRFFREIRHRARGASSGRPRK
ncbi:DUF3367 domain-containing protein [Gordonia sinesedis]